MNKQCKKCGSKIPWRVEIDGVIKNIRGRKFCLDCSPWGERNTKDLTLSDDDRKKIELERNRKKSLHYYYKNPGKQQKDRENRKRQLVEMLGGKCEKCGYDRCLAALQFHHRDPKEKKFSLSTVGMLRKLNMLVEEAKKCMLLCANCHCEHHNEN